MPSLSEHGGFAEWLRELQVVFHIHHFETGEEIAALRIIPLGYECDEAYVLYGIYVDISLERLGTSIPRGGDFVNTNQFRELAQLLSAPLSRNRVELCGETFQLEFRWLDDGCLQMDGQFGIEGWCPEYLESQFKKCPFRIEHRFKSSLSEQSLVATRRQLARLLQLVTDVETGKPPSLPEIDVT